MRNRLVPKSTHMPNLINKEEPHCFNVYTIPTKIVIIFPQKILFSSRPLEIL